MADQTTSEPFKEIYDGIKGTILERISSPLLFSFSLSWLLINFRLILIVISSEHIRYKLKLINWYFNITAFITDYLPAIAMLLYVFAYPYVARYVSRFVLERKLDVQSDTYKLEKEQLVSENRLKAIQANFYDQKEELRTEIRRLNTELEETRAKVQQNAKPLRFESLMDAQSAGIGAKTVKPQSPIIALDEAQIKLINALGEQENKGVSEVFAADLYDLTNMSKVKTNLAMETLASERYISSRSVAGGRLYKLAIKGREAFDYLSTAP